MTRLFKANNLIFMLFVMEATIPTPNDFIDYSVCLGNQCQFGTFLDLPVFVSFDTSLFKDFPQIIIKKKK